MTVVGVDGCRGGWFAIRLEPDGPSSSKVFKRIADLWGQWSDASLILIDIPIGLPDATIDRRRCDSEARKVLGPRHPSVFTPPCRDALQGPTYEAASAVNFEVTGRKLSKQTWNIVKKMREVDTFVRQNPETKSRIREIHPEVCFWAIAGMPMTTGKRKRAGWQERLDVLTQRYPATPCISENALGRFLRREVARDDILDALVAALTAKGGSSGLRTLPGEPQWDACGLPMEMVYCQPGQLCPGQAL